MFRRLPMILRAFVIMNAKGTINKMDTVMGVVVTKYYYG
jgi:hypothetical protein